MSEKRFIKTKHIVPAAHTRNVQRGVRDEDLMSAGALRLAVNQYIPRRNQNPQLGDLTIIFVHGVQSAKECYEPLFDDMLDAIPADTRPPIRAIWIADMATQCESFLLNEGMVGDQTDKLDCARDLMQMINHLQANMPPPLVGMGQSAGVGWLAAVSVWNPRLFAGLIGIEATIGRTNGVKFQLPLKLHPGLAVAQRRDRWESRDQARKELRKRPYYKVFDRRAFDKVVEHELRDDPAHTANGTEIPVILTTPKSLELSQWGLPDPPITGFPLHRSHRLNRMDTASMPGFFNPDAHEISDMMRDLAAPILFIRGTDASPAFSSTEMHIRNTGTGVSGSGGRASGQVTEKFVAGGHTLSFENPQEVARVSVEWLLRLKADLDAQRETRKTAPPFLPYGMVQPELMERWLKLKL